MGKLTETRDLRPGLYRGKTRKSTRRVTSVQNPGWPGGTLEYLDEKGRSHNVLKLTFADWAGERIEETVTYTVVGLYAQEDEGSFVHSATVKRSNRHTEVNEAVRQVFLDMAESNGDEEEDFPYGYQLIAVFEGEHDDHVNVFEE